MKSVTAVINRQALVDNLKLIRSKVPESNLVAVVKANAYGHGLVQVARTLEPYVEALVGEDLK